MKKSTISLCLITKTYKEAEDIIEHTEKYFDKIYVQCNAEKPPKVKNPKVETWYKKWTYDFAEARNDVLDKVETDYWFWMDTDDIVDLRNLPYLIEMMDDGLDAIYLPYHYAHDEFGNVIAVHWRERIIRTSHPFRWMGAVHETLISNDNPRMEKSDDIIIVHKNTDEDAKQSAVRNHEILEREWKKTGDPRYAHYLGLSYFNQEQYMKAIQILRDHIQNSGWDEEQYRSQIKIAEAYFMLGEHEKGVDSALIASKILPDYPDAYMVLAQIYFEMEDPKKTLEWLKVAKSKPIPDTLSMVDPSLYGYRSTMLAAMANMHLGKYDVAYALILDVLEQSPTYDLANKLLPDFEREYGKWVIVDRIKKLATAIPDDEFAKKLYLALPDQIQRDPRLYTLKKKAIPAKKWPKGSIVFFCGATHEKWGPDTLEKGMGGSEEAVVYLARELRDLGHDVTVYNTREEEYDDNGVKYFPWYDFEYRDTYDTLVMWRAPQLASGVKARNLFVDLHDVKIEEDLKKVANKVDKFFVKSKYHRNLFPNIPDDKFVIVGNGIKPSQFKPSKEKVYDVGYFSAPNRGLETLLMLWPRIKKEVPDAKGIWNYGWETYIALEGKDALYKRIKQLLEDAEDFEEGGRISHEELAENMGKTKVWGYPTEFPEIFCITALKAQESGMWPVTTPVAALTETVQDGDVVDSQTIYSDLQAQDEFVEKVVAAIKKQKTPKKMVGVSWKDVAEVWHTQSQA